MNTTAKQLHNFLTGEVLGLEDDAAVILKMSGDSMRKGVDGLVEVALYVFFFLVRRCFKFKGFVVFFARNSSPVNFNFFKATCTLPPILGSTRQCPHKKDLQNLENTRLQCKKKSHKKNLGEKKKFNFLIFFI